MSKSTIEPRYYCGECDRFEDDPIFIDTETCGKCGELIQAVEEEEFSHEERMRCINQTGLDPAIDDDNGGFF